MRETAVNVLVVYSGAAFEHCNVFSMLAEDIGHSDRRNNNVHEIISFLICMLKCCMVTCKTGDYFVLVLFCTV